MSTRSVSVSWGNNDSFQSNGTPQDKSQQGNSLHKSAHTSTAFYSFNTSNSLPSNLNVLKSVNNECSHSNDNVTLTRQFEWLQPWRTPQDARDGGLALLHSMQEILHNVQRARLSSMNEVYVPVRGTSTTGTDHNNNSIAGSSANQRFTDAILDDGMSTSPNLRLSMRNTKRRQRPTNASNSAAALAVDGARESAEVSNGSVASEGATLMDYMLRNSNGSRHTSHMWLDDARVPRPSSTGASAAPGAAAAAGRTPTAVTPTPTPTVESVSEGEKDSQQEELSVGRNVSRRERKFSFLDRADGAAAPPLLSVEPSTTSAEKSGYALPAVLHPTVRRHTVAGTADSHAAADVAPSPSPSPAVDEQLVDSIPNQAETKTLKNDHLPELSTASKAPAAAVNCVPAIPRFEELKAEQEALLKIQEAYQGPHPRSEEAQRKRRALLHSSEDEDEDEDDTSHDGSPHAASKGTARLAAGPSDSNGGGGTARPSPPPPLARFTKAAAATPRGVYSSDSPSERASEQESAGDKADHHDRCPSFSDRESGCDNAGEEEGSGTDADADAASDNMSATNFGEGGHLACVPGDTLHNRYTLLRALGVGRSSRVWLAADLEQCSLARRQLIRELGEREARRLFRPADRPMFVAIKVFRCSAMYADCATYEAKLSTFVKDSVRLRQVRGLRSPLSRSFSLVVSPNTTRPAAGPDELGGGSAAATARSRRSRANSNTPLVVSPPQALVNSGGPRSPGTSRASTTPAGLSARTAASSFAFGSPTTNTHNNRAAFSSSASAAHSSKRLTTFRDAFTVEGPHGTHHCLVMDVLGSGVDKAINETHLAGFPSEVARSIMLSTLQGLSVLAACHVIHTDLKPENLLFTDLEADVAAAMSAFQSSQLQTGERSGLWSSFTHRRENVLAYSQRQEQGSRHRHSTATSPEDAKEQCDEGRDGFAYRHSDDDADGFDHTADSTTHGSFSNSGSANFLLHTRGPHHSHQPHVDVATRTHSNASFVQNGNEEKEESDTGGRRSGGDAAVGREARGSSNLTSPLLSATRRGRGSAASSFTPRRAARRPAYEVRVSDFGLSFITPPCLRLGVLKAARYTEEVGITEDDLVHDDALSQLQWLYNQQQQQLHVQQQQQQRQQQRSAGVSPAESGGYPMGLGSVGAGSSFSARPAWSETGGVLNPETVVDGDLIDEAELRALQLEEAREDDERVRRKSDVVDREMYRGSDTDDSDDVRMPFDEVDPQGTAAAVEKIADDKRLSQAAIAPAAAFTSVLDVRGSASVDIPQKIVPTESTKRFLQQQQQTTQPEHARLHEKCSLQHSSASNNNRDSSSSSATVNGGYEEGSGHSHDSLGDPPGHRRSTRAGVRGVCNSVEDTDEGSFMRVAPAAPVPPIALRTASYHSPVSHPLTALPSAAMMPTAPQSPHGKLKTDEQEEDELDRERNERGGHTACRSPSSPQLSPRDALLTRVTSPHHDVGSHAKRGEGLPSERKEAKCKAVMEKTDPSEGDGDDEPYATPPPPQLPVSAPPTQVCAPALLSGRSSAVSEDAPYNAGPTSYQRPAALNLSHLPNAVVAAGVARAGNKPTTARERAGEAKDTTSDPFVSQQLLQQQQGRRSALVSPRSHPRRRSPTSALAGLTALRRLELDIIRNQRYTRGSTIQSREYRAPEVLLGNFFLPSCDVWSIGCIAYELVTGRFLIDCIADREHFGRQLARHLRREERAAAKQQQQEAKELFKNHNTKTNNSGTECPTDEARSEEEEEEDVEWDGQPIYVDDDEQDLDVFHLKAMLRLLGPPPLTFLTQRPTGLFVDDYFDADGNFKFWEEGEAEECGMGLADAYRRHEQLQLRRQRHGSSMRRDSHTSSSGMVRVGGLNSAGGGPGGFSSSSVHFYSRHTNDGTFEDEYGAAEGELYGDVEDRERFSAPEQPTRSSLHRVEEGPLNPPSPFTPVADGMSQERFYNKGLPTPVDQGGAGATTPSTDATPSILSMTPRSYTASALSSYARGAANTFAAAAHAGGAAAATTTTASVTANTTPTSAQPTSYGGGDGGFPPVLDTRNYPIETPDWVEVRTILRRKLKSTEEARDLEQFLWKCLQWDPAQRATAAELLTDNWIVKYAHKVADAVDSGAEEVGEKNDMSGAAA